jgi:menaquinone-dependent protoporphyrinogen oxidase
MNRQIGIIYSTKDGQTRKICEEVAFHLRRHQKNVLMYPIEDFKCKITDFEILIIGACIRYGKHCNLIKQFVCENKPELQQIRTAFFSVNLVARKNDKNTAETNPYLIKFLKETNWNPDNVDVFAGKLNYEIYSWIDKIMIKLIMKLTHGPTRSKYPIEFTDWDRVKKFSEIFV